MNNLKQQTVDLKIEVERLKWSDATIRHVFYAFVKQVAFNNLLLEKISQLEQEIKTLKNIVDNHEKN